MSFSRDIKSRWSLLSGVNARRSKRSHTGKWIKTCCAPHRAGAPDLTMLPPSLTVISCKGSISSHINKHQASTFYTVCVPNLGNLLCAVTFVLVILSLSDVFQSLFDDLWSKFGTYSAGESLFGMPSTEFQCLHKIKKELNLLQKLYSLYNAVMISINGYYEILWVEVDIEKINIELLDFQSRCVQVYVVLIKPLCLHMINSPFDITTNDKLLIKLYLLF